MYYIHRWSVLFHIFEPLNQSFVYFDICKFFALYSSNILHRQFWYLLRIIQELSSLCTGETTTYSNSKWNKMRQGARSFRPIVQFYLYSDFHSDMASTGEKTTDYHQHCRELFLTRLCFLFSHIVGERIDSLQSILFALLLATIQNLQEWIALWKFSIARVEYSPSK